MSDATAGSWVAAHAARALRRREGLAGGREPEWLALLRRQALASFAEQGFPTRKLEDWKYTNVGALAKTIFDVEPAEIDAAAARAPADGLPAPRLVFVDGRFEPGLSDFGSPSDGVDLLPLAEARHARPELLEGRLARLAEPKRSAFDALNTAFLEDGVVLVLGPEARPSAPIQLLFLATSGAGAAGPRAGFPRLLVAAGRGSEATLVQEHRSLGASHEAVAGLTCCVSELFLDENAGIEHVLLQHEAAGQHHVASIHVEARRDARYRSHTLCLGPGFTRNDVRASMLGSGADCRLHGLFIGQGKAHIDNHTTIEHAAAHCTSDELYKGILDDEARGVFRGRVIVAPGAQKTAAAQRNPNLLLSKRAEVDTRPQLEIHADDVKCSHGSTIGRLDPDALFYLRARGLDARAARRLLTMAFAREIGDALPTPELLHRADALIREALAAAREDGEEPRHG